MSEERRVNVKNPTMNGGADGLGPSFRWEEAQWSSGKCGGVEETPLLTR